MHRCASGPLAWRRTAIREPAAPAGRCVARSPAMCSSDATCPGMRRKGLRASTTRSRAGAGRDKEPELVEESLEVALQASAAGSMGAGEKVSRMESTRMDPRSSPVSLRSAGLKPGDTLQDTYTIVDVLGSGSNATAYRASKPGGGVVALKALSLSGLRDWKQLELFQREAQVLASLQHPCIPKYIDYFEADTENDRSFFIVQEVVVGKNLEDMVASGMRASDEEAIRIATELLNVLEYLGSLRPQCIHRDIKPSNIVIEGGTWGGRVFLVDFGGVQSAAADVQSLGSTVIGTYGYMAPEQFQGSAQAASDLYALGGTLLYLLTGRTPNTFPQERMRIKLGDAVQFPDGSPWSDVLSGLLEPVAEDRLSARQAQAILRGEVLAQPKRRQTRSATSALTPPRSGREAISRMARGVSVAKPAGTRVQLQRSASRLDAVIPPKGLDLNTGFTGAFAVAWNAFVAVWTIGALSSGGILFALFSVPFWFAGVQIGRQAIVGALMRERFAFGLNRFRLAQELAVLSNDGEATFSTESDRESKAEGRTSDLLGARVITTIIVNGEPQTAIEILEGVRKWRFGEGLQLAEQQWLVSNINEQLSQMRGAPVDYDAFPLEDVPEYVRDDTSRTSDVP
eukprot:355617-Chlamydomonas_euryale.AAC.6